VNENPTSTSVTPVAAGQGAESVSIPITGTGFSAPVTTSVGPGITVDSVTYIDSNHVIVHLSVDTSAVAGSYDVTLVNSDGGRLVVEDILTVNENPVVTPPLSPVAAGPGAQVDVPVSGSGFSAPVTGEIGPGITVDSVTVIDSTHVIVHFTVDTSATAGTYALTLTNSDGGTTVVPNFVTISAAPTFTSVSPASRGQGAVSQILTVTGTNFLNGAKVSFSGSGITVHSTSFVSATSLTVSVSIDTSAVAGSRNLTITNPDSGYVTASNAFTVNENPTSTSVTPVAAGQGAESVSIPVTGTGFSAPVSASFGPGITVDSVTVIDSTHVVVHVSVDTSATAGSKNLTLTNGDGGTLVVPGALTVNENPVVTPPSSPVAAGPGAQLGIPVSGSGFSAPITGSIAPGIKVDSVTVIDSTHVIVHFTVDTSATAGTYALTLVNSDGGTTVVPNFVTISAAPTFTSVSPTSRGQGAVTQTLTVAGTNFVNGAKVSFSGIGITVHSTSFVSATSLTVSVSIDTSAATGLRSLTITNPDSGFVTAPNAFTVTASPMFTSVSPSSRGQGAATQTLTVTGANFVNGAQVSFSGTGITVHSTTFNSATSLTVSVSVDSMAPATARSLTITNPDSGFVTASNAFTVNARPTSAPVTPVTAGPGAVNKTIAISGSGFTAPVSASFGPGITVDSVTVIDSNNVIVHVSVDTSATPTMYDLTLTNGDGGMLILPRALAVNPALSILSVTPVAPVAVGPGTSSRSIAISGSGFSAPMSGSFGPGITVDSVTVIDSNNVIVHVSVGPSATVGDKALTLTNGDGGTVVVPNVLTVMAAEAPPQVSYPSVPAFMLNTPITPVLPVSAGGSVTSYSVLGTALPVGLSLNASTGEITGTPTNMTAPAIYSILASGPGGLDTATVILTVNLLGTNNPLIVYPTIPTFIVGTPIAPVAVNSLGGPVTSYSMLGASLPAGLSLNAATGEISGTPTLATAVGTYSILATGPGGFGTTTISLTVNERAPAISYPAIPTFIAGTPIAPIAVVSAGGPVTSYSVSGAPLPAGLSLNTATGEISGTPTTALATGTYSIQATGPGGFMAVTISLTVNEAAPVVNYPASPVLWVGKAITPIAATSSGGPVTAYSVIDTLPNGLSLDGTTGIISGTPTAAAEAGYRIVATGPGGQDTTRINLTVAYAKPKIAYAASLTFVAGSIPTTIFPSSIGGQVTSFAISPDLTAATGLLFDPVTGSISGTRLKPLAPTDFVIVATGPGGTDTTVVRITVNDAAPVLSYGTPAPLAVGKAMSPLSPVLGGTVDVGYTVVVTGYAVVGTPLPAGLTLNPLTGVLSGTPTVAADSAGYRIEATGPGGRDTATVILIVHAPPSIAYPAPLDYMVGTAIEPLVPASNGGMVTGYALLSGSLPRGLKLDPVTGQVTGTPLAARANAKIAIVASGPGGQDTALVTLTVQLAAVRTNSFMMVVSGVDRNYPFLLSATGTGRVTVTIADAWGNVVWSRTVTVSANDPVTRELVWDGRAERGGGRRVSAGVYAVRVTVTGRDMTSKVTEAGIALKRGP
jgi:hypothetical protein